MSCIACQSPTRKYKCPKCLEPYCSLPCYKQHRELACTPKSSISPATAQSLHEEDNEPTLHEPFRTEDTVPRSKLEQLRNCESLRSLLCNPHLRNLLNEVDVAPNAWKAMRAAMQEPLFVEFADECLQVVEPAQEKNMQ